LLYTVGLKRETIYCCPLDVPVEKSETYFMLQYWRIGMSHDVMTCMSHQFFPSQNAATFIEVGITFTVT